MWLSLTGRPEFCYVFFWFFFLSFTEFFLFILPDSRRSWRRVSSDVSSRVSSFCFSFFFPRFFFVWRGSDTWMRTAHSGRSFFFCFLFSSFSRFYENATKKKLRQWRRPLGTMRNNLEIQRWCYQPDLDEELKIDSPIPIVSFFLCCKIFHINVEWILGWYLFEASEIIARLCFVVRVIIFFFR